MKTLNRNHIKETLSYKSAFGIHLLFIFTIIYLISTGMDHKSVKLPLLCVGLFLIVFFVKSIRQPLLWYVFLGVLITDLICDYFVRANHHFLLIYLTISIIIFLHNSKMQNLEVNIQLLLVIVLLFSGLQKLFSPQFVSGDFFYYSINTGNFFKPLLYFDIEMNEIIESNKAQIDMLGKTDPNNHKTVQLQNVIPNLEIFSRIFAWIAIGFELLTALLILWKPKHPITHFIFILLIFGIFFTRLENGFMALLAISGVFLTDSIKARFVYAVMAILFMVLIIIKIGFY